MKLETLKLISILFIYLFSYGLMAQNIVINENGGISKMMSIYKNANKQKKLTKAWRIQIITTDDRRKMEMARSKFKLLYPGIKSNWKHVSPWYHLKVGAYKTKLELQGFLIQVKKHFPGAIPIIDLVMKEELLSPR